VPCARPVEASPKAACSLLKPSTVFTTDFTMIAALPWGGRLQISSILWLIMQSWCHFPNFSSPLDFQIASKHHQGSNPTICTIRQRWGFWGATVGPGRRRPHREPQIWKEVVGSKTQGTSLGYFSQMMRTPLHQPQRRQHWRKSLDARVAAIEIANCLLITHNGLTSMKCHLEVIHITM
jgi:hypothetical protein